MDIPTTLKHKPVFVCDNYENIDGRQAYQSDAKGLSLGLAQWNDRGRVDISAKVWRHTGEKWSRQSEELPLHRAIDLVIFAVTARQFMQEESYRYEKFYDPDHTLLKRIGLQGDAMNVKICTDNAMLDEDIRLFADALGRDDELLSERLRVLRKILDDMDY